MTDGSARAQTQEERARRFRAIFTLEHGYVWNSLRRLGVRERDLPDVTHDVFVVLYRILDDYDPARPIRPYLFGIAFRVASDYRRLGRNKNEQLDTREHSRDSQPDAEQALDGARRRALVHAALEALEPDRRAVFILHELDGVAMPEIAASLGIPLNTGYSRLRLARQDFKAAVQRLRHEEAP